ncbi:MAG: ester cyclase [Chloroflexi bacterium]|nr:ester cyclase [Chloroflexota bacterium]
MYVEANRAIARYVAESVWNQGKLDVIDDVFAPGFVNHDPSAYQVGDCRTLKRWIERLRVAFPDMHMTIDDLIAERDRVVVRWTWTGTHTGFLGTIPPSENSVTLHGITIELFADGKVAEAWWSYDGSAMMLQIGAFPVAAEVGR